MKTTNNYELFDEINNAFKLEHKKIMFNNPRIDESLIKVSIACIPKKRTKYSKGITPYVRYTDWSVLSIEDKKEFFDFLIVSAKGYYNSKKPFEWGYKMIVDNQ